MKLGDIESDFFLEALAEQVKWLRRGEAQRELTVDERAAIRVMGALYAALLKAVSDQGDSQNKTFPNMLKPAD
jgi:hypothetical protein